jgi:hypothetical protein
MPGRAGISGAAVTGWGAGVGVLGAGSGESCRSASASAASGSAGASAPAEVESEATELEGAEPKAGTSGGRLSTGFEITPVVEGEEAEEDGASAPWWALSSGGGEGRSPASEDKEGDEGPATLSELLSGGADAESSGESSRSVPDAEEFPPVAEDEAGESSESWDVASGAPRIPVAASSSRPRRPEGASSSEVKAACGAAIATMGVGSCKGAKSGASWMRRPEALMTSPSRRGERWAAVTIVRWIRSKTATERTFD